MIYCPNVAPDAETARLAEIEAAANARAQNGDPEGGYAELTRGFAVARDAAVGERWWADLRNQYSRAMLRYGASHFVDKLRIPPQHGLERPRRLAVAVRSALQITGYPTQANSYDDLPDWIGNDRVEVVLHGGEAEVEVTPLTGKATIRLPANAPRDLNEVRLVHELGHVVLNWRRLMRQLLREHTVDVRAARLIQEVRLRQEARVRMFAASWFLMPEREAYFGEGDQGLTAAELVRERRAATSTQGSGDSDLLTDPDGGLRPGAQL